MDKKTDRPEAVVIDRKKYDIEFENLGLTLPNGVEIMRVSLKIFSIFIKKILKKIYKYAK